MLQYKPGEANNSQLEPIKCFRPQGDFGEGFQTQRKSVTGLIDTMRTWEYFRHSDTSENLGKDLRESKNMGMALDPRDNWEDFRCQ